METPVTIHDFWFGSHADDANVARAQSRLWWTKHVRTDEIIRERFEADLRRAAKGELDTWRETPQGRLALILLTDQFPRNMYRNTPQAFAFDHLARAWSNEGLQERVHQDLRPIERVFFYLPLEHSESMEDQERAVLLFQELVESVGSEQKSDFKGFLDFAIRHRDVVARFGRFPHRNAILGRSSTPEELAFLAQPGSSF